MGWIEPVPIQPEGFELIAKIDTGADNSSLDVTTWTAYTKDGSPWIRFEVRNNGEKTQKFELSLEKYTLIKRKQAEPISRPVIKMSLCIDNREYLASVNLAKREDFKYRMLIGRSFLKGRFLVDSDKRKTSLPKCNSLN